MSKETVKLISPLLGIVPDKDLAGILSAMSDMTKEIDALKSELRELKGLVVHNELDPRP